MHLNPIAFYTNIVERSVAFILSDIGLALKRMDHFFKVHHTGNSFQRAEQTYFHRVERFVAFHNRQHPADMPATEINAFLIQYAVKGIVSA